MTTSTDIANEALEECVARSTITSFQEKSKEARTVSVLYDNTRDAMLRAAPWNFARATVALTLLKALPGTAENPAAPTAPGWQPLYPAPPWIYSYAQPFDCVRVRYVVGQSVSGDGLTVPVFSVPSGGTNQSVPMCPRSYVTGTDVDQQGNPATVILTNQSQALCVYTRRIENPDLWDVQFHQAMVKALAARLVLPLSGDKGLKKSLSDEARQMITEARVSDGNEGTTIEEWLPDWIRVRGYGSAGYVSGWRDSGYAFPGFLGI